MAKKMLIDDTQPEETRVVVLDGNKIEDVEFESSYRKQIKGNDRQGYSQADYSAHSSGSGACHWLYRTDVCGPMHG